jgi:predicted phage terminase large subunit-like protein
MKFNDIQIDPIEQLRLLDRVDCEDSLYLFLKSAWKYIDTSTWQDGWAIQAVAEHLEAVCDGSIRKLCINIPPRHSKSSLVSVAYPAWTWAQRHKGHTSGPNVRFLVASYAQQLVLRDSVRCRRLIESPWYQKLWGSEFSLTGDQNTKSRFSNDKGGERLITSVGAAVTGEGGDVLLIDDPNAAQEAFSEASTIATIEWWDGAMSTRLNDARRGAYVLIQQRLSEMDLTGHIQEKQSDGWDFLVLPAEYEPDRKCYTSIGWEDPRTKEGELLWPERFGPDEMKGYKSILGPFGFAGQMQQRPEPAGGGIIKREYWQTWDSAEYPPMDYILATVDTAYTEKTENDPSAMTVWGVFSEDVTGSVNRILDADGRPMYAERASYLHAPKVMLMYAWTERLEFHQLVEKVAITAKRLKVDKLLIEAKASGISVAQEIRRLYSHEGFGVQLVNPGALDKVARLHSVQHIFADLIVHAPNKEWAETTITQVAQFPKGRHDDLVDCTSMAVRHLRDIGMLTRAPERQSELDESLRFRGNEGKQALYPT